MKVIMIEDTIFVLDDIIKVSMKKSGSGKYNHILYFYYKGDTDFQHTNYLTENYAKQTLQKIMEILEKPLDK